MPQHPTLYVILALLLLLCSCFASQTGYVSGDSSRGSRALLGTSSRHAKLCSFFKVGLANAHNELMWGNHKLCPSIYTSHYVRAARGICHTCSKNEPVCDSLNFNKKLSIHLYQSRVEAGKNWENLHPLKLLLLTQDLSRTEVIIWADEPADLTESSSAGWFFSAFDKYIKVQRFNYAELIRDTPFEKDDFFSNETAIKSVMNTDVGFSDLARLLIVYNYGGLYIDWDTWLLQDVYPVTVQVDLQFITRWTNSHVFYLKKKSPLGKKLLQLCLTIPFNVPDVKKMVEEKCDPLGYLRVSSPAYSDIYNFCLFRMVTKTQDYNREEADALLFDHPLGWWDPDWAGCLNIRDPVANARWPEVMMRYLAFHTRYPKDLHAPERSSLKRTIGALENMFEDCKSFECVPVGSVPL